MKSVSAVASGRRAPPVHDLAFRPGRADHGMELDRGRVPAGGRLAPQRLGHRADVVRAASAADADVGHADVAGTTREVGHLEAGALERLEPDREEVPAAALERLEG